VVVEAQQKQQSGKPEPFKREPLGQRALTALLNTTNVPCG
jgi:hypothetical protein